MSPRKGNYDKDLKEKILSEITEAEKSIVEIASEYSLDPALLRQWKHRYVTLKESSSGAEISQEDYEHLQKELKELKKEKKTLLKVLEKLAHK